MIIALTGPSGSGKTALENYLCQCGFKNIISYTTREPRLNETNHVDYHFISELQFSKMVKNKEFAEWDEYTGRRFYGTTIEQYTQEREHLVCVLTPRGIQQLKEIGIDVIVVYVDAPLKVRAKRYLDRIDSVTPEVLQELYARSERDSIMFQGVKKEADIVLANYGESLVEVGEELCNMIGCKKKAPTLYIDFDNTLVNTTKRIVSMYNKEYCLYKNFKEVNPDEVNSYGFRECACAPKEIIDHYFNRPDFFEFLTLQSDAHKVLEDLCKSFKIKIVSMGYSPNLRGKEQWLKRFPYVEFVGCNLKEYDSKAHIDMSDGILLDDSAKMLETSNAATKVLFGKRKYDNSDWNGHTAETWSEFEYKLLRGDFK